MKTKDLKLGDRVIDDITEFSGIVTGIVHYISGCDQALIKPALKPDDPGTYPRQVWLDIDRLHLVEAQVVKKRRKRVGSDLPAPIR